jgi:transcriptional regulator GlxA family with amidase domain
LVLFGLYDVLSTAGAAFVELAVGNPGEPMLDVRIVAATPKPFRCTADVLFEPGACIDDVARTDVAIVCDMYVPIHESPRGRHPREVAWLRRMHAGGSIVASVCSGSLVLAEAGLLDGRVAASHWVYRDMFREHYPSVKLRVQDALTVAGDEERIVTTGSAMAWQDLALHLIARLCGPEHAVRTIKAYMLTTHEGGQLPYAVMTQRLQRDDRVIHECQAWIGDNYAGANPVSQMVERSGLNARTFARRFHAATGYSPMDYVHILRMEEAKQILETEAVGIDDVSHEVGYEDPGYFRRLFKRKVGLNPAGYRRKFRS